MKSISRKKFREGAASFYIVAFSTLILMILAMSFAAVVVSEIERTSNDDLAQSAYDSALAGIEDAKLAFYSYQNCIARGTPGGSGSGLNCKDIVRIMENPDASGSVVSGATPCQMVGRILGRAFTSNDENGVVEVKEHKGNDYNNNMQQAYTCVKIDTKLKEYISTLSGEDQTRTIKAKFTGVLASEIDKVKISWYSKDDQEQNTAGGGSFAYSNFSGGKVVFPSLTNTRAASPPTISLAMTQTKDLFTLEDFYATKDGETDRGLIYLVPMKMSSGATGITGDDVTYRGSKWDSTNNVNEIGRDAFLKSNEKTVANLPYGVNCPEGSSSEFACSALISLPEPVGGAGARNDDTFMFTVSIPYGKPKTTFALEFFCKNGVTCGRKVINEDGSEVVENETQAYIDGVQIKVDSTGRANDLFRRVEVRMDYSANSTGGSKSSLSLKGPLQLTGTGGGSGGSGVGAALKKDMTVTCEYNFSSPTCN